MDKQMVQEKFEKLNQDPDGSLFTICAHVANGGSLMDLCKMWGLAYGHLMNWIREDRDRDQRYQKALVDRGEWAKESIIMEMQRLALADARSLYTEEGILKPPHDWDDATASLVKKVVTTQLYDGVGKDKMEIGEVKTVELWSKEKALQMAAKNLGMLIEKVEHTGKVTLEDLINEVREGEKSGQ